MQSNRFSKVLGDVSHEFDRPRDILHSADLSQEQKIELIKEWEFDLRELQVASEGNMTGADAPGSTVELLRECRRALARLGAAAGDSGGAPTKQGGARSAEFRVRRGTESSDPGCIHGLPAIPAQPPRPAAEL